MKNIILLIAVMVLSACATAPTVPLTMKSVAGTYERKESGQTYKSIFLESGVYQWYFNGKKQEVEGKWKIVDGEIHITHSHSSGKKLVFRINKDRSITIISGITKDGKRVEAPKEEQKTAKKIK